MTMRLFLGAALLLAAADTVAQKGSVFVNGLARVEENGQSWYINTKGEKVFDSPLAVYHPADALAGTGEGHSIVYTNEKEQLMLVRRDHKTGLISDQGTWLLPPEYDTIDLQWKTYLRLKKDDKVTYADTRGKLLLPLQFEEVGILDDDHFDVKTNGKWGIFSTPENKLVIPAIYDGFDYCGGCGSKGAYVFAQKDGKWGVVDFENKTLIPFEYEHEHMFMRSDNWILCFKKAGKEVVLNLSANKEYLAPEYTDMELLGNGLLKARKNGHYGLIREDGTLAADFVYDEISSSYGEADAGPFLEITRNKKTGIIREDGKIIIPPTYTGNITCFADCFIVPVNGNYNLLDTMGKKLLAKDYNEITGMYTTFEKTTAQPLFKLKQKALYGFYNPVNKKTVEPAFFDIDRTDPESSLAGLLEVVYQEKKGLYNVSGEQLLPVAYRRYAALSPALLAIKVGEHAGVYDIKNKRMLLPANFDDITVLPDNNLLQVTITQEDGSYKNGIYDIKGGTVLPLAYSSVQPLRDHQYLLTADKGDKRQYILFNGISRQQTPLPYDRIAMEEASDRMLVSRGNKAGMINAKGDIILPLEYDEITFLKNNNILRLIKKKSETEWLYGYADSNGKILVPLVYDYDNDYGYVSDRDTAYLALSKRNKDEYTRGLATLQGAILIPPVYDRVLYEEHGRGFLVKKDQQFAVLNNTGQQVTTQLFDDVMLAAPAGYGAGSVSYSFPLLCRDGDHYQYLGEDGKPLSFRLTEVIPFAPENYDGILEL
ncbi:WG repeat-containing protein [Chitinophaga sp. 22321]|uniref:WG repeat-containing protein n=1 Tax=Chitinophaga hostae TaxID=2831022 RepID=A0ABS5J4C8_9BACT|nr:WG repeat-containing protein [Chitinophaga hostae]MBS0029938.1 WG repeat-containing protein [Chitinophaga hostae]